jgi:hypothetical protein
MEEFKQKFESVSNLVECKKLLCEVKFQKEAKLFLEKLNLDLNPRIFLTAFFIHYFKENAIGSVECESNKKLLNNVKDMIESSEEQYKEKILSFSFEFQKWSKEDLEVMKQDIFYHYHTLSVEILNTEEEEVKEMIRHTQETILKCARSIGYEEELKRFVPVVFEVKKLEEQYDQAFYDVLEKQLGEKKFDMMKNTLEFIQSFFKIFVKEQKRKEIDDFLDIKLMEQEFKNDCYTMENFYNLFSYFFNLMKELQSTVRDEELKKFQDKLEEKKENLNVIEHIRDLMQSIKWLIEDFEALKEQK